MLPIHYVAVLAASLIAFVLQFLISGPLFGTFRMSLENNPSAANEKPDNLGRKLLLNILANIVTAYFIAVVYFFISTSSYGSGAGIWQGIESAIMLWFGFLVTATSIDVIWHKKLLKVWLFESTAALLVYIVMGAVIALL